MPRAAGHHDTTCQCTASGLREAAPRPVLPDKPRPRLRVCLGGYRLSKLEAAARTILVPRVETAKASGTGGSARSGRAEYRSIADPIEKTVSFINNRSSRWV